MDWSTKVFAGHAILAFIIQLTKQKRRKRRTNPPNKKARMYWFVRDAHKSSATAT